MRKSFKYRLFTNANQERELEIALETHRRIYNECLGLRVMAYNCYGVNFTYYDCHKWYKAARRTNPFIARTNFSSAQGTLKRLDFAFANFFRRYRNGEAKFGFPKYKGKNFFNSIEFTKNNNGIRLQGNKLRVQYIGTMRVKLHRPIEGEIKTIILKREADKWYACFSCDLGEVNVVPSTNPPVGIDVGLSQFLTTSDGHKEPCPRYLKTALPQLRRLNRSMYRKKVGGTNRRKAAKKLRKVYAHISNCRREHHYQVACRLVVAYGLIVAESLNIQKMLGNHRFSLAITDAAWAGFLVRLHQKANKAGVRFIQVDAAGTSQTCLCGHIVPKTLKKRWHNCDSCGLSADRDHVAAQVILARGLGTDCADGTQALRRVVLRSRRVKSKV